MRIKIRGYDPDILRVEEKVENPAMQVRRLRGRKAYAFPNEMLNIHITTRQLSEIAIQTRLVFRQLVFKWRVLGDVERKSREVRQV